MPPTENWEMDEAMDERARADAAWLVRERDEHAALTLSLAEELAALLETMQTGEPHGETDLVLDDPPDWPAL